MDRIGTARRIAVGEGSGWDRSGGNGVAGRCLRVPLLTGLLLLATGCLSTGPGANAEFEEIPMNRVVPYPSDQALAERALVVRLEERAADTAHPARLEALRAQLREALERLAAGVGATVVDETATDDWGVPVGDGASDPHYALGVRFTGDRFESTWRKPFRLLWQTEEDLAGKPGTCTHVAHLAVELELESLHPPRGLERTYRLEHTAEQSTKDLDPSCTLPPVTRALLFETALEEALGCLDLPLGEALAPRGHVTAHRKLRGSERHVYRISLGTNQGLVRGDEVEIRREQRAQTPSGGELRTERVIAIGEVTDRIEAEHAWVAVDPGKAMDVLLDGDVVRPVFEESLLGSLTGPDCDSILQVR